MKTILYDVMIKDYRNRETFRIGSVPERRGRDRTGGRPDLTGGLRYARQVFGGFAKDPNAVFIIPVEEVASMNCSCPSRDVRECYFIRYPEAIYLLPEDPDYADAVCKCPCHDEYEEKEEWHEM